MKDSIQSCIATAASDALAHPRTRRRPSPIRPLTNEIVESYRTLTIPWQAASARAIAESDRLVKRSGTKGPAGPVGLRLKRLARRPADRSIPTAGRRDTPAASSKGERVPKGGSRHAGYPDIWRRPPTGRSELPDHPPRPPDVAVGLRPVSRHRFPVPPGSRTRPCRRSPSRCNNRDGRWKGPTAAGPGPPNSKAATRSSPLGGSESQAASRRWPPPKKVSPRRSGNSSGPNRTRRMCSRKRIARMGNVLHAGPPVQARGYRSSHTPVRPTAIG